MRTDFVGVGGWGRHLLLKEMAKGTNSRTAAPVIFILNLHDRHVNWWSSEGEAEGAGRHSVLCEEIVIATCECRWLPYLNKRLRRIWEENWDLEYENEARQPPRYARTDCVGIGWTRLTFSIEGADANIFDWNIRKNKTCCGDVILHLPNWHMNWILRLTSSLLIFFKEQTQERELLRWFHVWHVT